MGMPMVGSGDLEGVRSAAFARIHLPQLAPNGWSRMSPLDQEWPPPLGMDWTEIKASAPTMCLPASADGRSIRGMSCGLRSGDIRVWLC